MAETRSELNADDYRRQMNARSPEYGMTDDPQQLEREIEETRREMAETVDAIQERLDPDRLKREVEQRVDQAVERAKSDIEDATIGRVRNMTDTATRTAQNWRHNVVETVKSNPVPAALVGVGLGWLIMEGSNKNWGAMRSRRYDQYGYDQYGYDRYGYDRYGYAGTEYGTGAEYSRRWDDEPSRTEQLEQGYRRARHEVEDRVEEMGERIEGAAEDVRARAEHLRDEATEQFDDLRDEASMRARRLQQRARMESQQVQRNAERMMNENPLAMGAAALALGVLVGWALPSTEVENRLVGEYRDDLVDQARHEAQNVARTAQSAVKDAVEDVKNETTSATKQAVNKVTEERNR